MAREWRLNPPPNWPVPVDAVIGLDWRPDPAWGPPPVGWELWQRRRIRTDRPAGPLTVALASLALALTATLVGEPATAGPCPAQVVSAVSAPVASPVCP